jgi:hypothetical protein
LKLGAPKKEKKKNKKSQKDTFKKRGKNAEDGTRMKRYACVFIYL